MRGGWYGVRGLFLTTENTEAAFAGTEVVWERSASHNSTIPHFPFEGE